MIKVGVYGNMFALDWSRYKCLATQHTWYYNLWELCYRLGVTIELEKKHYLGPVREGDNSIIDAAVERGATEAQLEQINTVRKHLGMIHLSDLVLCDGKSLCGEVFETGWDEKSRSRLQFPREKPAPDDFNTWRSFVLSLTSDGETLTEPLGEYLKEPHTPNQWKHDPAHDSLLLHDTASGQCFLYQKEAEGRHLRSGQSYTRQEAVSDTQRCKYGVCHSH